MSTNAPKTGVILMTYGSATTAEHARAYLNRIYGKPAPEERVKEFESRYDRIGGSPLVETTAEQARFLEAQLGPAYVVRSGMRHSEPSIESAIADCAREGATRLIGVILSPQFSSFIMGGYRTALHAAAAQAGFPDDAVIIAAPWPAEPDFISLTAARIKESLAQTAETDAHVAIVYTTHSLPERVVREDPTYLAQLSATTDAIRTALGENPLPWYQAYQSAGHTPEQWLKPDLTDILDTLTGEADAVLIVPVQFLADHLETLYDLDCAAREQCEARGIAYHRIALPNADPRFIASLAATVRKTGQSFAASAREAMEEAAPPR